MLCKPAWLSPRAWLARARGHALGHAPGHVQAQPASSSQVTSQDGVSTPPQGDKKGVVTVENNAGAGVGLGRNGTVRLVQDDDVASAEPTTADEIPLDAGVLTALPDGAVVLSCTRHGYSPFSKTGKLVVRLPPPKPSSDSDPGSIETFFIKIVMPPHPSPRLLVRAEFWSASAIHALAPGLITKPVACGRYSSMDAHFFIASFVDMEPLTPETAVQEDAMWNFVGKLAEFHRRSATPGGRFGKPRGETGDGTELAWNGATPVEVPSRDTWEECFAHIFKAKVEADVLVNGAWDEYQRASQGVVVHVIPRLLSPGHLKSPDGGEIVPTLIHGDLRDANVGIVRKQHSGTASSHDGGGKQEDAGTEVVMFDSSGFYAHNEMDVGQLVGRRCRVVRPWADAYATKYPPAEPVGEFEDRLRLYATIGGLSHCADHPGSALRAEVYNGMLYLVEKYAPGKVEGVAKYRPASDDLVTGQEARDDTGARGHMLGRELALHHHT